MAEIKIEKKKPIWLWIILALIILAGIIYFIMYTNGFNSKNEMIPIERDTISKNDTINDYYNNRETDTTYTSPRKNMKVED